MGSGSLQPGSFRWARLQGMECLERVKERDDRERHTQKETERQKEKQRQKDIHTETEIETYTQKERDKERERYTYKDKEREKESTFFLTFSNLVLEFMQCHFSSLQYFFRSKSLRPIYTQKEEN